MTETRAADDAGLEAADLDAIVLGNGPGSFIGMRIAASVAQGLAHGASLKIVPVSSLAALAQGVYRKNNAVTSVCAAFDARIEEIYWGNFQLHNGVMNSVTDEAVNSPEDCCLPDGAMWTAVGSAWSAYPQMQARLSSQLAKVLPALSPLARAMIPLARQLISDGQAVAAEEAIPVYLRQKVAQTIEERKLIKQGITFES